MTYATPLNADNLLFDTDSYKYSHATQYPDGTSHVFSYIEPRRGWDGLNDVVFFGLQAELLKLAGPVVTDAMVDEAEPVLRAHGLTLYAEGWRYIARELGGHLPLQIDAMPEGTVAPVSVPQVRITNTDPRAWWLPSFLETRLLRAVWYPSTVASLSRHVLGEIRQRLIQTDGSDEGLGFKLHDFGARGATSHQAAALGGAAHLVNALGTDTVAGLVLARNVYGADMAGFSIPATEHSTATAMGEDGECAFMKRLLDDHPTGLVACVSDSYDLMRAVTRYWGGSLRDQVMARDGTLVIRPDSGDAVQIVPAVIEALIGAFGHTTTAQGYRLLPSQVRVIQGDGVDRWSILRIMQAMIDRKLAIGNIAFGMGAGLLQKLDRDSFGYAMKTSAICLNGHWRDVWKDPVTAQGTKTSKRGRIGAMQTGAGMVSRRIETIPPGTDALRPVFRDGKVLVRDDFATIRARAALT